MSTGLSAGDNKIFGSAAPPAAALGPSAFALSSPSLSFSSIQQAPGSSAEPSKLNLPAPADSLVGEVDRIKAALDLDTALSIPAAIRRANELMELAPQGGLPTQAKTLLRAIGI